MNKLAQEKSPYLRQHATNPVEWYPWSEETLALAKKTNKPIFLSIGYSTCHWCHVMAHESFENTKIASLMNQHFLNIKVDREERPDVDAIYMAAVQALTGSGGWPMSVWLTPELKPFYAGTYFPPEDRYGRPGFPSVLEQLAEIWDKEPDKIKESANQITGFLEQYHQPKSATPTAAKEGRQLADHVFNLISRQFDPKTGGFGPAPKFPMPVYMEFLLEYYRHTKNAEALKMTAFTMENISTGGITDHLGGGFARYSTDANWVVPHFEKMLYDNAQLISVSAGLFQETKLEKWRQMTEQALGYVLRDLRHPGGGFYSAEDADSEGKEGTFYLWTLHEVKQHLSPEEAEAFLGQYPVTVDGNFMDPHTRETGKNVLVKKGVPPSEALTRAEKKLFDIRKKRPRPHRDEKILTEWNGLMISALVRAGHALDAPAYIDQAKAAVNFLQTNLYDAKEKRLYRSFCDGARSIPAQQSDYAMLIQALLDLFQETQGKEWLDWAISLQQSHEQQFFDEELGGYFMNVAQPDLLIRIKDDTDNVIPSGNSIAVRNGIRLAALTGQAAYREHADKTIQAFSSKLASQPMAMTALVSALL